MIPPSSKRYIAIGDVHGCRDELEELIRILDIREDDSVIFLGDLVNRGPDSHGAIQLARSLPNAQCILGNHEKRLLKYKIEKDLEVLKPGDIDTISSLSESDWDYIFKMKPYIHAEDIDTVFVHGGFLPGIPWQDQPNKVITRIQVVDNKGKARKRSECRDGTPWASLWEGPPYAVFGHTPGPEIVEYPAAMCIDTGCVYGGFLTALILPEKKIVQVPAKDTYWGKA